MFGKLILINVPKRPTKQKASADCAPANGSETCCLCNWSNTGLQNLGEFGTPRWVCHGCCKRMLDALENLRDGDFVGTPINRGSAAMMLIEKTLKPNG